MSLAIDMISDVVCPWCFIGKRRLEKAIALRPAVSVELRLRPYLLNPWVPREGMDRNEYLTAKFGSPERYRSIAGRVAAAAAAEGLKYSMDDIARQPNTIDCHRLILWARHSGAAETMKQRLMDLYFSEGGDLSNPDVLVRAASECGLDADAVRHRLSTDEDVETIVREANWAKEHGVDGVPYFVLGDVVAVQGAQSAEYLVQAIDRAVSHAGGTPADTQLTQ